MGGETNDAKDLSINQHYHPPGGQSNANQNILFRLMDRAYNFFDRPVTWFRESIVEPNRKDYNWYHRSFRRVPTIDECYTDDYVCIYEANDQFIRDRNVDNEILCILRQRMDDCVREEYPDYAPRCLILRDQYELAAANWFTKYGDLGADFHVKKAYMKQKHRLLWERRHGPVGCGMKDKTDIAATTSTE